MKGIVIKIETYLQTNILTKLKLYWRNIIIDFQISDTWRIQVTIAINFISSKDVEEECVMHSMSDNIKRTSYKDAQEVVDELLNHFDQETSLRRSNFIFESVQLMYYKCHKVNFRRDGSFIYSPGMIKK